MANYDKPIIYEDDENMPSPVLLVAVNAIAIVNIVGAINFDNLVDETIYL